MQKRLVLKKIRFCYYELIGTRDNGKVTRVTIVVVFFFLIVIIIIIIIFMRSTQAIAKMNSAIKYYNSSTIVKV